MKRALIALVLAVSAAALTLTPDTAQAQRRYYRSYGYRPYYSYSYRPSYYSYRYRPYSYYRPYAYGYGYGPSYGYRYSTGYRGYPYYYNRGYYNRGYYGGGYYGGPGVRVSAPGVGVRIGW